jgi:DNA-binding NarL/FixJ family response regulator
MSSVQATLARGHEAFDRFRWEEAYACLSSAESESPLEPRDLERLAMTAHLTGRDAESLELLARTHHACLKCGDVPRAARCAFWLAAVAMATNDLAQSSGWIARARRVLDENRCDTVERGYLLVLDGRRAMAEGQTTKAHQLFEESARIGERFGDSDLVALARQACGRALIRLGDAVRGGALLDEVMVAVTSGELSPIVAGTVYCSVISACFEIFDIRRAREWTEALNQWCSGQPGLVPYRGACLVHRAEILRLRGVWPDAISEAQRACDHLTRLSHQPEAGAAFYQLAELERLQGRYTEAEHAYRRASDAGRGPQPGLALLRLAQGKVEAASVAIDRALHDTKERRHRAPLLAAAVEIMLAAADNLTARRAADELTAIADEIRSSFLEALAAHVSGAVLLAEGNPRQAAAALRNALAIWREVEAPYDAARAGVLLALACRELGDTDGVQIELDAARRTFVQLGATPDVTRVDELLVRPPTASSAGLTEREIQVLKLVASGKTNRGIAEELAISEKTVARHLSNIFVKLDLTSRAAATAYAFQHRLV